MNQADERGHVNIRAVVMTTVILFGSLLVGALLMWVYFEILESRAAKGDVAMSRVVDTKATPPEPRLQYSNIHPSTEVQDLAVMRAHEDSLLHTYGWADRPAGIVRIPIDRAIELVGTRGAAPAAKPAAAAHDTAASAAAAPAPAPAAAPAAAPDSTPAAKPVGH